MNADQKSALFSFLSYIFIIITLLIIHFQYENLQSRFLNYSIIFILFSLIWFILPILGHKQDKKNILLKNILLIIEGYLILVMLIKPELNFSQWEFIIFYLSCVWIYISTFDYIPLTRYLKLWLSLSTLVFMMSIEIFMIYRKPLNLSEFIESRNYYLHYLNTDSEDSLYSIIDRSTSQQQKKRTQSQNFSFILPYNESQNIQYSLLTDNRNFKDSSILVIQDPSWNLFEISPQSKLSFSTITKTLNYQLYYGKIKKISLDSFIQNETLSSLQNNYKEQLSLFVKKKIPLLFSSNQKLEEISFIYTKWLANWNPFYQKNGNIAEEYHKFFIMKNMWKRKIEDNKQKTVNNYDFWLKSILWKTQIFQFYKKKK